MMKGKNIFGFASVILVLICLLSISCQKQTVMETATKPLSDKVTKIPAYETRDGDPVKGQDYLLNGGYVDSGIPLEIFKSFFNRSKDELGRTGVNEGIPHDYNAFLNEENVAIVSPNCMQCHAGFIEDEFILGLGNTKANFTVNSSMLSPLMDAAVSSTYGQDSPEWRGYERFSTALKATGDKIMTEVVGANSADKIAAVLAAHRNKDDLTWLAEPRIPIDDEVIPTDVPPWWLLKKKNAMFYTGVGRGDFARISMASSVLTMKDSVTARNVDDNFVDVIAFLKTLEPPAYKEEIDMELALEGKLLFEKNCASCHGKYGADESYPNLLVDVSLVQTDPMLLSANFGYGAFVDWYNSSWFGQGPNRAMLVPGNGYVAPPLDGIWASAPYLHNGSVPTVEAVLNSTIRPAIWKRSKIYDHESLGFSYSEPPSKTDIYTYDTSLPGYGNMGHYFGDKMTSQERSSVVEYLKTL